MELVYFILASYGLTQIIVYGSIFKKFRDMMSDYTKLFSCAMCTGFWIGVILFFLNPFTELFTFEFNLANLLICGWISSGTSYILCMTFDDDGIKIMGNQKWILKLQRREQWKSLRKKLKHSWKKTKTSIRNNYWLSLKARRLKNESNKILY